METLTVPTVEEMSAQEGRAMLAQLVADRLALSLDEFFQQLDAGTFDDVDSSDIRRLVLLAPFAR